jgi:tetratricopeptide (TPR) repeat protein
MAQPYDLDAAWREVLTAFEKTARIKLKPEKILTPDDVLQQLRLKREQDDEASQKHQKLKQAFRRALNCVQKLGTIAAQDQSGVLGPSNLVYCAIVVLIQAGDAFKMIYENLERLWDEVANILERFDLYQNMSELDIPLRKIIHEMLQAMVSICALSIKVLNENRLLKYLRALAFNEDDGVRAELSRLRKLVEREASMNATLTYRYTKEGLQDANEAISGVRSAVDRLANDASKRESDTLDQKHMERIKTVLGVQKDGERQAALYRQYRAELVSGTGSWINNHEAYKKWADVGSNFSNILLISGDQGYGKSFLCTTAIRELQKIASRSAGIRTTTRSTVAYFYIQSEDTKSSHGFDMGLVTVDRLIKCLAVQLAQDPVYRKTLAAACEAWVEPDDVEELCVRLLDQCYRSTDIYFLVVDGLDRAGEKQINGLASVLKTINSRFSPKQRSRVRIMVSGRAQIMSDLAAKLNDSGLLTATIDLAKNSSQDVALFIRDRLDNMSLLEGDSLAIKDLRSEVYSALVTIIEGDFVHASLLLNEISTKQWPSEIRDLLAQARQGGQRADTIAREVARCNTILSAQEIRDLNVLLLWVACAGKALTVSELEAILFLSKGENSLRPLRDQLQEKYAAFFHIDESSGSARVSLSSDPIRQYFAEASEQGRLASQTSNKVNESEVKIVRRFLASVCDEELYAKFGFDDFFTRRLNSTTAFVHVDLESAGIVLLTGCMLALTSKAKEATQLLFYARTMFPKHMAEVDLSMTSPVAKVECGRYLLQLFTEQDVIARWWSANNMEAQTTWFYADDNVDLVLAFFRDTAITKTFTDDQRVWIKALTSKASPDTDLLEHVVRHLSRQLLSDPCSITDLRTTVSCLNAYRTMLLQRRDPNRERTTQLKDYQMPPEKVVDLFTWMADFLGEVDIGKSYAWNRCLATILADFCHTDAALAQYQIAIPMAEDCWECQLGLGIALSEQEEFEASNEVLEEVERHITDGTAKQNSPEKWLRNVRQLIGMNYRQLDEYDAALEIYAKHIHESKEKSLVDYGFTFDRIRVLSYKEEYDTIIEILRSMQSAIDPNFGIRLSSRLLHWMCFDGEFEMILVQTCKATGTQTYMSELLSEAIDDTHKPDYLRTRPMDRAMYRVTLKWYLSEEMWRRAKTPALQEETIAYWEELGQDALDIDDDATFAQVAKRLATVYIQQMRDLEPDSVKAQELSKRAIDLAVEDSTSRDSWSSGASPRLLLARHLNLLGRDGPARMLAKGSVKIALDLLTDADPDNDWEAYIRLAFATMYCGHDDDALAAWSLIWPQQLTAQLTRTNSSTVNWLQRHDSQGLQLEIPVDSTSDESSDTESSHVRPGSEPTPVQDAKDAIDTVPTTSKERYWRGAIAYQCDGLCTREWTYADDIYVCKDCLDVMFCENCLEKRRSDKLEDNICDAKHEFLHVPSFSAREALSRGKDNVRIRGTVVPVSEWLEQIRLDWGLEVVEDGSLST